MWCVAARERVEPVHEARWRSPEVDHLGVFARLRSLHQQLDVITVSDRGEQTLMGGPPVWAVIEVLERDLHPALPLAQVT